MNQSEISYKAKTYFDNNAQTEKLFGYTTVNIGDKERSIPRHPVPSGFVSIAQREKMVAFFAFCGLETEILMSFGVV